MTTVNNNLREFDVIRGMAFDENLDFCFRPKLTKEDIKKINKKLQTEDSVTITVKIRKREYSDEFKNIAIKHAKEVLNCPHRHSKQVIEASKIIINKEIFDEIEEQYLDI